MSSKAKYPKRENIASYLLQGITDDRDLLPYGCQGEEDNPFPPFSEYFDHFVSAVEHEMLHDIALLKLFAAVHWDVQERWQRYVLVSSMSKRERTEKKEVLFHATAHGGSLMDGVHLDEENPFLLAPTTFHESSDVLLKVMSFCSSNTFFTARGVAKRWYSVASGMSQARAMAYDVALKMYEVFHCNGLWPVAFAPAGDPDPKVRHERWVSVGKSLKKLKDPDYAGEEGGELWPLLCLMGDEKNQTEIALGRRAARQEWKLARKNGFSMVAAGRPFVPHESELGSNDLPLDEDGATHFGLSFGRAPSQETTDKICFSGHQISSVLKPSVFIKYNSDCDHLHAPIFNIKCIPLRKFTATSAMGNTTTTSAPRRMLFRAPATVHSSSGVPKALSFIPTQEGAVWEPNKIPFVRDTDLMNSGWNTPPPAAAKSNCNLSSSSSSIPTPLLFEHPLDKRLVEDFMLRSFLSELFACLGFPPAVVSRVLSGSDENAVFFNEFVRPLLPSSSGNNTAPNSLEDLVRHLPPAFVRACKWLLFQIQLEEADAEVGMGIVPTEVEYGEGAPTMEQRNTEEIRKLVKDTSKFTCRADFYRVLIPVSKKFGIDVKGGRGGACCAAAAVKLQSIEEEWAGYDFITTVPGPPEEKQKKIEVHVEIRLSPLYPREPPLIQVDPNFDASINMNGEIAGSSSTTTTTTTTGSTSSNEEETFLTPIPLVAKNIYSAAAEYLATHKGMNCLEGLIDACCLAVSGCKMPSSGFSFSSRSSSEVDGGQAPPQQQAEKVIQKYGLELGYGNKINRRWAQVLASLPGPVFLGRHLSQQQMTNSLNLEELFLDHMGTSLRLTVPQFQLIQHFTSALDSLEPIILASAEQQGRGKTT